MNPELYFDKRTLSRLTWKESPMRTLALLIVNRVMRSPINTVWPDEIPMTTAEARPAPNVWRVLLAIGIIRQNGEYRRSNRAGRRASLIFQYQLSDRERAEAFLWLNKPKVQSPPPIASAASREAQGEMSIVSPSFPNN